MIKESMQQKWLVPTLSKYPSRPNSCRQHRIELGGLGLCRIGECESGVRIREVSKLQSLVSDFESYQIKAFVNYYSRPCPRKEKK